MFGPLPPLNAKICCSRHHSYSASVSPFQAKTGTPVAAMAAAAWSWVEKMLQLVQVTSAPSSVQRLDEHGGLNGHVQAAGDARALERLLLAVLLAQRHEAGHLLLGDGDLLAAPVGEADVLDLVAELLVGLRHVGGHCLSPRAARRRLASCSTLSTVREAARGFGWQTDERLQAFRLMLRARPAAGRDEHAERRRCFRDGERLQRSRSRPR